MADSVYKETTKAPIINIKYYKPTNSTGRPFIPVEFAVAAYRFGHSMTRPRYTVRDVFPPTGTTRIGSVSSVPLFDGPPRSPTPGPRRQQIERTPRTAASAEDPVEQVLQRGRDEAYRSARAPVRCLTGHPLFKLPANALPDANTLGLLSQRNLRRGRKMGLPSGQQVGAADGCDASHSHPVVHGPQHQGNGPDSLQQHRGAQRRRGSGEPGASRTSSRIRTGPARPRSGSTSLRRPSTSGTSVPSISRAIGSMARAARWALSVGGLWPRCWSDCCRRTSTLICTSSPPGSPPHRSRQRLENSPWLIS